MKNTTRRMGPIDRTLAVASGVMGVAAFVATVLRHDFVLWALPFGILALFTAPATEHFASADEP